MGWYILVLVIGIGLGFTGGWYVFRKRKAQIGDKL